MHEHAFADVSRPLRYVVLKIPLLDFSIGHRIFLLRQRNPLLTRSEEEFNQLPYAEQILWIIEAVYICAKSCRERTRLEYASLLGWRQVVNWLDVKGWHWRRKGSPVGCWKLKAHLSRQLDWAVELVHLRNYFNSARVITDYDERKKGFPWLPCTRSEDAKGRSLGAPFEAILIQLLIEKGICRTEAEALEYPFGAAQAHYFTWLEREGAIKIINAFELESEEHWRGEDLKAARAAGFETVAEHVADITAKIKAKTEAETKTAAGNGLATEPPDELKPESRN